MKTRDDGNGNLKDETLTNLTKMKWIRQRRDGSSPEHPKSSKSTNQSDNRRSDLDEEVAAKIVTNGSQCSNSRNGKDNTYDGMSFCRDRKQGIALRSSVCKVSPEHFDESDNEREYDSGSDDCLDREIIIQRRKSLIQSVRSISKPVFPRITPAHKNFDRFYFVEEFTLRQTFDKMFSHHRYPKKVNKPYEKKVTASANRIFSSLNAQAAPFWPQKVKNWPSRASNTACGDSEADSIRVGASDLEQSVKKELKRPGFVLNRNWLKSNSCETPSVSQGENRLDSQSKLKQYLQATLNELDALRLNNFSYFRSECEPTSPDPPPPPIITTSLVSMDSSIVSTSQIHLQDPQPYVHRVSTATSSQPTFVKPSESDNVYAISHRETCALPSTENINPAPCPRVPTLPVSVAGVPNATSVTAIQSLPKLRTELKSVDASQLTLDRSSDQEDTSSQETSHFTNDSKFVSNFLLPSSQSSVNSAGTVSCLSGSDFSYPEPSSHLILAQTRPMSNSDAGTSPSLPEQSFSNYENHLKSASEAYAFGYSEFESLNSSTAKHDPAQSTARVGNCGTTAGGKSAPLFQSQYVFSSSKASLPASICTCIAAYSNYPQTIFTTGSKASCSVPMYEKNGVELRRIPSAATASVSEHSLVNLSSINSTVLDQNVSGQYPVQVSNSAPKLFPQQLACKQYPAYFSNVSDYGSVLSNKNLRSQCHADGSNTDLVRGVSSPHIISQQTVSKQFPPDSIISQQTVSKQFPPGPCLPEIVVPDSCGSATRSHVPSYPGGNISGPYPPEMIAISKNSIAPSDKNISEEESANEANNFLKQLTFCSHSTPPKNILEQFSSSKVSQSIPEGQPHDRTFLSQRHHSPGANSNSIQQPSLIAALPSHQHTSVLTQRTAGCFADSDKISTTLEENLYHQLHYSNFSSPVHQPSSMCSRQSLIQTGAPRIELSGPYSPSINSTSYSSSTYQQPNTVHLRSPSYPTSDPNVGSNSVLAHQLELANPHLGTYAVPTAPPESDLFPNVSQFCGNSDESAMLMGKTGIVRCSPNSTIANVQEKCLQPDPISAHKFSRVSFKP